MIIILMFEDITFDDFFNNNNLDDYIDNILDNKNLLLSIDKNNNFLLNYICLNDINKIDKLIQLIDREILEIIDEKEIIFFKFICKYKSNLLEYLLPHISEELLNKIIEYYSYLHYICRYCIDKLELFFPIVNLEFFYEETDNYHKTCFDYMVNYIKRHKYSYLYYNIDADYNLLSEEDDKNIKLNENYKKRIILDIENKCDIKNELHKFDFIYEKLFNMNLFKIDDEDYKYELLIDIIELIYKYDFDYLFPYINSDFLTIDFNKYNYTDYGDKYAYGSEPFFLIYLNSKHFNETILLYYNDKIKNTISNSTSNFILSILDNKSNELKKAQTVICNFIYKYKK